MLQLGTKNKTFNSFETNVLKRAIEEINRTGVMQISIVDKIKKGRSVNEVVFSVKDNEPRNYLKQLYKEKDESVLWMNYIKVENQALLDRLIRKYDDMDLESPIVQKIFCNAYDKTLNKDNRFEMIQDKKGKTNFALFNCIVNGEFMTHELAFENQFI